MMPENIPTKEDCANSIPSSDPSVIMAELLKENEALKSGTCLLKKELSSFKIENEKNLSLF